MYYLLGHLIVVDIFRITKGRDNQEELVVGIQLYVFRILYNISGKFNYLLIKTISPLIIRVEDLSEKLEKDNNCKDTINIVIPILSFTIHYFTQVSCKLEGDFWAKLAATFPNQSLLLKHFFISFFPNSDFFLTEIVAFDFINLSCLL